MTRFMITLDQGVELVWHAFEDMIGGEIYVKKIPSMKVTDLARVVAPECKQEVVGIRPGEKLHEQMIGAEDAYYTYEYPEHFKILPTINEWGSSPARISTKALSTTHLRPAMVPVKLGSSLSFRERLRMCWESSCKLSVISQAPVSLTVSLGAYSVRSKEFSSWRA
jgi:hypothetical protein